MKLRVYILFIATILIFGGCRKTRTYEYWLVNQTPFDVRVVVKTDDSKQFVLPSFQKNLIHTETFKRFGKIAVSPVAYIQFLSIKNPQETEIQKAYRNDTNWSISSISQSSNFSTKYLEKYEFNITESDF
ncbi:MAG: hypothetical protein HYZ42_16195 [Bacteroidetes bacterium]|nr:hypothetical protein [Bacteroidota bacterium]